MEKLTGRDYNILAEIDRNPKVSFHQIGKKLRLSPSVVERRIKNLIILIIAFMLGFKIKMSLRGKRF